MKRIEIRIYGQVQGVFFRTMVENLAKELGLKGYVENMYDESVHIVAEGGEKELEKLLEFCKKGPSAAQIENVEINWSKGTGEFKDFKVKY